MSTRPRQLLVIALFALLQFVLQPLATASSCVMLASDEGGCHCAHAETDDAAPTKSSCCGEETPAPDQDDDCDCFVSPQPDPVTPVEALDLQLHGIAGALQVGPDAIPNLLVRGLDIRSARIRAPRVGPSRLLLFQVFRI